MFKTKIAIGLISLMPIFSIASAEIRMEGDLQNRTVEFTKILKEKHGDKVVSKSKLKDPDALLKMLPAIDGVSEIFKAYIDAGYDPFFSYIMTSYDIVEALRQMSPDVVTDEDLKNKVDVIMDMYEKKEKSTSFIN